MKIGAVASCFAPGTKPDHLLSLVKNMDQAGLDSLWFGEHVMLFDEMEFGYPGSPDGKLPVPAGQGAPDQTALIGFLASHTRQLRFGTSISLIPQRNPVYTAKAFATLDWLTGGRIQLGVGVGWCKEEVEACGYEWETRGERCDEALVLMDRLWSEEVVTHVGKHFAVNQGRMDPKPSGGQIPLIVGGYSRAAMRRTARFGSGWLGFGLNPQTTRALLKSLDEALDAEGRTRSEIKIVMMPGVESAEALQEFAEIGVDCLVPMVDTTSDFQPRLEQLIHLKQQFDQ
ncbi:MAG: TIGR03619 family F420-dependent LLM class oxidoreductase [Pseudomonadota bacterium]